MAVRFQYRGIQIEADSRVDVDSFLDGDDRHGQERDHVKEAKATRERRSRRAPVPEQKNQLSQVRQLLESLDGAQLAFMKAIEEQPSSDADLRRKLSLDSNKALAGVRSAISKRAKTLGISGDDLIEVEKFRSAKGKGRTYRYKPGKLLREALAA